MAISPSLEAGQEVKWRRWGKGKEPGAQLTSGVEVGEDIDKCKLLGSIEDRAEPCCWCP